MSVLLSPFLLHALPIGTHTHNNIQAASEISKDCMSHFTELLCMCVHVRTYVSSVSSAEAFAAPI